jgi:glycosyltransferase involved in cell wall biosynthesis
MMKCLTLQELPPPPLGKSGWPWTEGSVPSPSVDNPLGRVQTRISIITPSFNQGQFIEETIRSVLLQGYPDLEYFVIDGGSTDETLNVIRKYEPWLENWLSEPDNGQSHAINKGLRQVTGSIWGWINSDDLLMPGSLSLVADAHLKHPRALIAGDVLNFWPTGSGKEEMMIRQSEIELRKFVEFWNRKGQWHQPGIFFPTYLRDEVGLLDESLRYLFDYDLLCRALTVAAVHYLHQTVASFRLHEDSKTVSEGDLFLFELCNITKRHWPSLTEVDRAGYERHAAGLLFCTGCQRLMYGRPHALSFIGEGLKTHPWWAITSALMLLPGWLRKKWQSTVAAV